MNQLFCRYRPPHRPQHDVALLRLNERITFSEKIMPICLPKSTKFPDKTGVVYVAGWGLHHEANGKQEECTTNKDGPDPFSKCKFPFRYHTLEFFSCIGVSPPSSHIDVCKELKKQMLQNKNRTNLIEDGYARVRITNFLKCQFENLNQEFKNSILLE